MMLSEKRHDQRPSVKPSELLMPRLNYLKYWERNLESTFKSLSNIFQECLHLTEHKYVLGFFLLKCILVSFFGLV